MNDNQVMDLKIRLGYKESITLSRDEFNSIFEHQDEMLEEEAAELEGDKETAEQALSEAEEKIIQKNNRIDELKENFVKFLDDLYESYSTKIPSDVLEKIAEMAKDIKDEIEDD